jgi:GT2 family glycosyltransferase
VQALETAVRQTRPPREIIVVDASAGFAGHREAVLRRFADAHPRIRWDYLPSPERSLTFQRNIGLAQVTCPVAFFFDDDTLLFDDCAEEILLVYERDAGLEVGGVCADLSPRSPLDAVAAREAPRFGDENRRWGLRDRLADILASPWDQHRLFVPYDGTFHGRTPRVAQGVPTLVPEIIFHGCRMTFRTDVIRRAGGFEEVLTRHAFGEDVDASYRVSRTHALLLNRRSRVFHSMAPAARSRRTVQATLVILNAVVLFRLHRNPALRERSRVWGFIAGRLLVELLRDATKPWRRFPNFRGAWGATAEIPRLLKLPLAELRRSYPGFQQQLIDARR